MACLYTEILWQRLGHNTRNLNELNHKTIGRMKLMISRLYGFMSVCFGVEFFCTGNSDMSFNNISGENFAGGVGRTMLILDFFRVS